ncbi:MAG TPA: septal ring lytic transglycosylase RlpA family protein [Pseudolabrys sp.]|nr:septal ring lytic transglycosylase RlpA family protein [Pseudolabrys sp.]
MRLGISIGAGLAIALGFAAGEASAQNSQRSGTRDFSGIASFYDKNYQGKTASGARYDASKFTAAHRTLPFGTRLTVVDPRSHRVVTVVVNDRGPFVKGRVLDLSYSAAQALRMTGRGVMKVSASAD